MVCFWPSVLSYSRPKTPPTSSRMVARFIGPPRATPPADSPSRHGRASLVLLASNVSRHKRGRAVIALSHFFAGHVQSYPFSGGTRALVALGGRMLEPFVSFDAGFAGMHL